MSQLSQLSQQSQSNNRPLPLIQDVSIVPTQPPLEKPPEATLPIPAYDTIKTKGKPPYQNQKTKGVTTCNSDAATKNSKSATPTAIGPVAPSPNTTTPSSACSP